MKRREPVPFQDLVAPLFQERGRAQHLTLTVIRRHWEEVVGPDLARKTHPLRVRRGVLWVAAPDSSWAYQLQFMRTEILQRLEGALGSSDVREVRFKEAPLPAPADAPRPPAPAEPDPLPDERLVRAAEAIADPALRALFVRSLTKQRQRFAARQGAPKPPD
jgi:hypothetical protein